jgi:inner membrane protein
MWQLWWVWVAGGFALGVLEVLAPGYIFLGFAMGAVLTGILIAAGFVGGSLSVLLLIFALASLAAWFGLRKFMGPRENDAKVWDRDINEP